MGFRIFQILYLAVASLQFFTVTLEVDAIRLPTGRRHTGTSVMANSFRVRMSQENNERVGALGSKFISVPDADTPEPSIRRMTLSAETQQLFSPSPSPSEWCYIVTEDSSVDVDYPDDGTLVPCETTADYSDDDSDRSQRKILLWAGFVPACSVFAIGFILFSVHMLRPARTSSTVRRTSHSAVHPNLDLQSSTDSNTGRPRDHQPSRDLELTQSPIATSHSSPLIPSSQPRPPVPQTSLRPAGNAPLAGPRPSSSGVFMGSSVV